MERKCEMFDCKEPVGSEGLAVSSLGRTVYICEKCVNASKRLKMILARQADGSYSVEELVGI